MQLHAKDPLANTIVPASAEIFDFGKLRHPWKLSKCILESPPSNDPAPWKSDVATANEWLARMRTISKLTSASAGQQFARWLASHSSDAKLGVLCHSDADGIAAGAILHRALQRSRREVATQREIVLLPSLLTGH